MSRKVKYIEDLHTEGQRGLRDLCVMSSMLGYHDDAYQLQIDAEACVGDLMMFLEDNPGAIRAIYEWVSERQHAFPESEFASSDSYLDEDESDDEGHGPDMGAQ